MAWEIDPAHSHAAFSVKHMMISTVKGQFNVLHGTFNIDEANPANSSVDAEVETASIDTHDANRDNHLRSADFFDVEHYPTITFKSTSVEPTGDGEYKAVGTLTMHGVTKEAVFTVEYNGQAKDPWGMQRAGLNAKTKINRKDFGLTYNSALEAGGVLVGEDVKVDLDLEAVNKG